MYLQEHCKQKKIGKDLFKQSPQNDVVAILIWDTVRQTESTIKNKYESFIMINRLIFQNKYVSTNKA